MFSCAARARILPFAIYIAFIVLADLLTRAGCSEYSLRWLYPLKIVTVVGLLVWYWRQYTELHQVRLSGGALPVAILAGAAVFAVWISLDAPWMRLGVPGVGYVPITDGHIDWLLAGVRLFGAAVVVPPMEELFWRSYLMRWTESPDFEKVDPASVKWLGFVITVILFAIEHELWLAGIVAGAVYGALYQRYRSLWVAILAHAVTNGMLGLWIIVTASWEYW
ncbi:CAAX prenyl protease-related protein [Duganella fentianensis]|uniref:CAAX prenyl protease-related protein n=1 Tax=Duganella fentianensis TaxID=2692177 RepID=UPI0032B2E973